MLAVDWQTLELGLPARDVAYFLGTGLDVGDRRAHERELVRRTTRRWRPTGSTDYSLEDCWDDYRFAMIQGPLVTSSAAPTAPAPSAATGCSR